MFDNLITKIAIIPARSLERCGLCNERATTTVVEDFSLQRILNLDKNCNGHVLSLFAGVGACNECKRRYKCRIRLAKLLTNCLLALGAIGLTLGCVCIFMGGVALGLAIFVLGGAAVYGGMKIERRMKEKRKQVTVFPMVIQQLNEWGWCESWSYSDFLRLKGDTDYRPEDLRQTMESVCGNGSLCLYDCKKRQQVEITSENAQDIYNIMEEKILFD